MESDLRRDQVCEILNCSRKTFYELLHAEDPLPAYKLGNGRNAEWRVIPGELRKWRERRRKYPPAITKGKPGPKPPERWQMIPTVKKYPKATGRQEKC